LFVEFIDERRASFIEFIDSLARNTVARLLSACLACDRAQACGPSLSMIAYAR
jgi:hypothetical protein